MHEREARGPGRAAGDSLAGLMSHFATADEDDPAFFVGQLERFRRSPPSSRRPSAARGPHRQQRRDHARTGGHFDLVRTGIAIYGLSPFGDDPSPRGLRPALRLTSYVAGIREVRPGDSVGYGRRFIADRPARLAIVPIGYADGVARALTNRGDVLIDGRRCRIAGTISMDQLTVLLPDDPAACGLATRSCSSAARARADPCRRRRPAARHDQLRGRLRRRAARRAPLHRDACRRPRSERPSPGGRLRADVAARPARPA